MPPLIITPQSYITQPGHRALADAVLAAARVRPDTADLITINAGTATIRRRNPARLIVLDDGTSMAVVDEAQPDYLPDVEVPWTDPVPTWIETAK